jgi:uncharacterized membrane protein
MSATIQETLHPSGRRSLAISANRAVYWLVRHWIAGFAILAALYAGLPWLAPVLMQLGWTAPGELIYAFYSTQCHQLPQRSYFLFGPQAMYSLEQIQAWVGPTANPLILRQFIGNAEVGWKVAWSDRMVAMYTGVFLFGLLYWPLRRRALAGPLSWWGFGLLVLPMIVDGLTHMISDTAGLGQGFRDNNAWLAALTGNTLPATFYAGDALGSFNGWMRLITGALFALGVVWLAFPHLERMMGDAAAQIEAKFSRAGLRL